MHQAVDSLPSHYENGRMSWRELAGLLITLAAAPPPSVAPPAALEAAPSARPKAGR